MEMMVYVDDVRVVACSKDMAWLTSNRVAKRLCLSLRDMERKRRRLSQNPWAWAGSMLPSDGEVVSKSTMQERWDKAR